MYVNGYKRWIESNREKGYVFVTKNKEFVEKKVKQYLIAKYRTLLILKTNKENLLEVLMIFLMALIK